MPFCSVAALFAFAPPSSLPPSLSLISFTLLSSKVGNPSDTEQTANDAARSFKVSNCRSEEEEEEEEEGGAAGHENWQGPLDDAAWSPLASADSELRVREAPGVARASGETLPSTLGSARGGAAYSYFIHAV